MTSRAPTDAIPAADLLFQSPAPALLQALGKSSMDTGSGRSASVSAPRPQRASFPAAIARHPAARRAAEASVRRPHPAVTPPTGPTRGRLNHVLAASSAPASGATSGFSAVAAPKGAPADDAVSDQTAEAARQGPFFVVFNAGSGHNDAAEEQAVMARVFAEGGREVEFLPITDPSEIAHIAERAVGLAQQRGGVVVAAGGDGTINAVASAVLGSGCPFGVLPQGTFNYFGRVHAIPQTTEAAARALLGASVSRAQVGKVNGRVFLVNASVGLYPQLLEDRETWKQQFGRSRAVAFVSGLATLLKAGKQLLLQIESGGKIALLRTPTLFVGNNHLQLSRVGIEERHADAVEQGQLAGIVVRPIGTPALFGLLLRGLLGRLGDAENVDSFSFRRITVKPASPKKIKVATDGEIVWMTPPLVFEVADQALLLMVPAPADRAEVA